MDATHGFTRAERAWIDEAPDEHGRLCRIHAVQEMIKGDVFRFSFANGEPNASENGARALARMRARGVEFSDSPELCMAVCESP